MSSHRLVANPFKITLRELMSDYENVTYPITLVCAGNRRKEQNVVRKSKGFSWGPAGLSTALFTGVVMKDIIERAKPLRRAKFVCMEGADKLVSQQLFAVNNIADIVRSPMAIMAPQ
jgi:nitrate reductase (NAD(P)H)